MVGAGQMLLIALSRMARCSQDRLCLRHSLSRSRPQAGTGREKAWNRYTYACRARHVIATVIDRSINCVYHTSVVSITSDT